MSCHCRHKNVVIVGSDETGVGSAHCADCGRRLTRRIEGGEYIYVTYSEGAVEIVYADRKSNP